MTNVERIRIVSPEMLSDLRERFGAENGKDTSFDEEIERRTMDSLMHEWCAWAIGDGQWWDIMKRRYDLLLEVHEIRHKINK